jgi:hypothetical protein
MDLALFLLGITIGGFFGCLLGAAYSSNEEIVESQEPKYNGKVRACIGSDRDNYGSIRVGIGSGILPNAPRYPAYKNLEQ